MSPLKKVGHTYTSYQGMYGAASPLPVKMVEKITSGRDIVKPVPIKFADKSDFQTQVDLLTKAFTSEMAHDAMNAKSEKMKHCNAMSSQHGMEENAPDKLLDRRKKYNSMRNELYKRSQIVSSYLSKYTKDKEKEKERVASAGVRRTKKYDHIQSKVDTNLRKYTSLTSLDKLKGHEQTRIQSAITPSNRTSSVENLSALNQRRVRSARHADEYRYLKPIPNLNKSSQQLSAAEAQRNEQPHNKLFSNPLEAFKTPPVSSADRLNFYSARFCRERLKKDKPEDNKQQNTTAGLRTLSVSRKPDDNSNKEGYPYSASMANLNKLKAREDLMSDELACIKSSYESMADQLRITSNPVFTKPPNNSDPIRSPRPSSSTSSTTFDPTPLYSKSSDLNKASSGVRLASNTYYDRSRNDLAGSLTEEYLKDVNNSINTYLGSGRSSQIVNTRVNYKPLERHEGGGGPLYKSASMDFKMDEPNEYDNNSRLKKSTSQVKSQSSEYNQLKETLCEASRRLGVSLPSVTSIDDSQEAATTTVTTTSPTTKEDSLRIHNWIDSISAQDDVTKEKEISEYKRPLSGVWSQDSNESEDSRPRSALLKSKWLSKSMPSDLDHSNSIRSILKKKKKVRINLEFNKTYLFKSEVDA